MTKQHFDAIVIGAGQGGYPLAVALAQSGRSTALIERRYMGGTCVNDGCTPTKTLVATARVAHLARRSADYGVHTGDVHVNVAEAIARKQRIVMNSRNYLHNKAVDTEGLTPIYGEAHFQDAHTLEIALNDGGGTQRVSADQIFINTGQRDRKPDLPGLDDVNPLNNTSILELDVLPEHLIVLGGGYVGLEFGQMFRRFGSRVTIVQDAPHLMNPREDQDVVEAVEQFLREDGIDLLLDAKALRAEKTSGGLRLVVSTKDGERALEGSHLLVGVGRTPNTDALNLSAAGIDADKHGYISVNDQLQTSVPHIYALGDVKGGPAFTHISYDDYRILSANIIEGKNETISSRLIPYTMFTDPEYARVGMNEKEAQQKGIDYRLARIDASSVARLREMGETRGFWKALVDSSSGQILGCAIVSAGGGEIMTAIQIAMMGKLHYHALRNTAFAHPTMSEALNNLFMTLP